MQQTMHLADYIAKQQNFSAIESKLNSEFYYRKRMEALTEPLLKILGVPTGSHLKM